MFFHGPAQNCCHGTRSNRKLHNIQWQFDYTVCDGDENADNPEWCGVTGDGRTQFSTFLPSKKCDRSKIIDNWKSIRIRKNTQNYTYRFIFSLLFSRNWFFCSVSRAPAGLKVLTQKKLWAHATKSGVVFSLFVTHIIKGIYNTIIVSIVPFEV